MAAHLGNTVKCVVVGDGAVGKTCLLVTYASGEFPVKYVPTIFDNYTVSVVAGNKSYNLSIFDTAGQEDYECLRTLSYNGTDVFVVCFSVVSPASFHNVAEKWMPELRATQPGKRLVLVGTQTDLRDDDVTLLALRKRRQQPVSAEQGARLARRFGAEYYVECSALTRTGLKDVFDSAMMAILEPKIVAHKHRSRLARWLCCSSGNDDHWQ